MSPEPAPSRPADPPPEQSVDDTDRGWGEAGPDDDEDVRRLRAERPPHWQP